MKVLETERLVLRWITLDDAEFILELVNEPSWIRFIGDRGVRTLDDARKYITNGPSASYARSGFGFYLVELKETGDKTGICGLVKRNGLNDIDIGFAFLPRFWGLGYAFESAEAVLTHARNDLGIARVVAITAMDNHSSMKLLGKLGMQRETTVTLPGDCEELMLFGIDFDALASAD